MFRSNSTKLEIPGVNPMTEELMRNFVTAIRNKQLTQIKRLLLQCKEERLDINSSQGNSLLHFAVQSGNIEIVALLLEQGADINAPLPPKGKTPLHIAAENGEIGIAAFLLEHNANPNATTFDDGKTPLHLAAQNGHAEVTALFLEDMREEDRRRIDPNVKTSNGATPLHLAIFENHDNVVEVLLADKRVTPDIMTSMGTSLHRACGKNSIIRQLVASDKVDINQLIAGVTTLLIIEIQAGNRDIVPFLLEKGAKPNLGHSFKPLCEAVNNNLPDIVELLLRCGADANIVWCTHGDVGEEEAHRRGENGEQELTPLCLATGAENPQLVELLLRIGKADPNKCSVFKYDFSKREQCNYIFKSPLGPCVKKFTPLHNAIRAKDTESIRLLLENKADANIPYIRTYYEYGCSGKVSLEVTPLCFAIQTKCSAEIIGMLLKAGAEPNEYSDTYKSRSGDGGIKFIPLVFAIQYNRPDIVKLLLEYGADAELTSSKSDYYCDSPRSSSASCSSDDTTVKVWDLAVSNGDPAICKLFSEDRLSREQAKNQFRNAIAAMDKIIFCSSNSTIFRNSPVDKARTMSFCLNALKAAADTNICIFEEMLSNQKTSIVKFFEKFDLKHIKDVQSQYTECKKVHDILTTVVAFKSAIIKIETLRCKRTEITGRTEGVKAVQKLLDESKAANPVIFKEMFVENNVYIMTFKEIKERLEIDKMIGEASCRKNMP